MIQNVQTETHSGTKQVDPGVESTTQASNCLDEIIKTSELVGDMIVLIATAATHPSSAAKKSTPTSSKSPKLRRRRRREARNPRRTFTLLSASSG
jgi:methyl-accepting chemotaxis protein